MGQRLRTMVLFLTALTGFASASNVVTYHNSNLRHGAYIVHGLTLASAANIQTEPWMLSSGLSAQKAIIFCTVSTRRQASLCLRTPDRR